MKKVLIFSLILTGCFVESKRYKVTYSEGRSSRTIFINSYSIDENGCLHIQDKTPKGTIGYSSNDVPSIICGNFDIKEY